MRSSRAEVAAWWVAVGLPPVERLSELAERVFGALGESYHERDSANYGVYYSNWGPDVEREVDLFTNLDVDDEPQYDEAPVDWPILTVDPCDDPRALEELLREVAGDARVIQQVALEES